MNEQIAVFFGTQQGLEDTVDFWVNGMAHREESKWNKLNSLIVKGQHLAGNENLKAKNHQACPVHSRREHEVHDDVAGICQ